MLDKLFRLLPLIAAPALFGGVSQGTLQPVDPYGKATGAACPLKHTSVSAEIAGFLARVTVTQQFENTSPQKIEAIYIFPLPAMAAVDDMFMKVGDRTVKGVIKRREEARKLFEQARQRGQVASLLDQERPNIFTQSVTNIEPGAQVSVTLTYVETLAYEEGAYEFSFPMTVGPRYRAGANIAPKVAPPETRAGHDISIQVTLDAGVAIDALRSPTHPITVRRASAARAAIALEQRTAIPNKDFILRYDVAGAKIQDAVLTHRDPRGGFFTLVLQPPERVTVEDVSPKEIVFVLDTSGSMSGFPIEKAKEAMRLALAGLNPRDAFNLITFSGDTRILFPAPVPASAENLRQAQAFLAGRAGSGGTEMMKAVRAAFTPAPEDGKIRIICFMTDGFVGNDMEIVAEVQRHPEARVFSFGIGGSVNRFLLDKMAEAGRGAVEYVGLNEDGSAAARRFHERVRNPLLTDIQIDWGALGVTDVQPRRIPDLFSARPVIVTGRYSRPASGVIRLRGRMSGAPWTRDIRVTFPDNEPAHAAIASLWARRRIEELMARDWDGHQARTAPPALVEEITQLGLNFRLMTQYTSFVAIEEQTVTRNGKPVVVEVPVEMPEGVSHEGVFGSRAELTAAMGYAAPQAALNSGIAGGIRGGIVRMPQAAHPAFENSAKVAPALLALPAAPNAWYKDGKVWIDIWLSAYTPQVQARLAALGFVESGPARVAGIRTGWLPASRLRDLESIMEVLSVNPHTGR